VIWANGIITTLELPIGPDAIAYDISDSGAFICGWMGAYPSDCFGGAHAFIWTKSGVIDLGTPLPGSGATEARAVNNLGEACGNAHFTTICPFGYTRAFFWSNGVMQDVGMFSGSSNCFALDLNDGGQIVGYCDMWPQSGELRSFIWQSGAMHALEDLVPPELNLSNLLVWSINNVGQIAGQANRPTPLPGDETVAVRLTPIIPPPGDCDCNGQVNMDDLLGVINQWGPAIPTTTADFNNDGLVSVEDLVEVLRRWSS
jgi:probable HAF family extracellular repeat protein